MGKKKNGKKNNGRKNGKLTMKKKVNELWEDKKDDKRILDVVAKSIRPTIPVIGGASGWYLYSFVDDIQMQTVVAGTGGAPIASSQVNGYRNDNKITLDNLSIDLSLNLPDLQTLAVQPNYAGLRFRVVIFSTASWHMTTSAMSVPQPLNPVNLMPIVTKYNNKGGSPSEMWKMIAGDQYLYGKFSCQPQGLKYSILYDKRHMLSFNTTALLPASGLTGNDGLSYSASRKNINIELKKKVKGHEVTYSLNQINGQEPSGRQEIDKGNLFMAIVCDFNPAGAPTGSDPSVYLSYRIKYFT